MGVSYSITGTRFPCYTSLSTIWWASGNGTLIGGKIKLKKGLETQKRVRNSKIETWVSTVRMCIYIRPPHLGDTPGARECESERESARARARVREREENKETDGRGRVSLRCGGLKNGYQQSGCVSESDSRISEIPRTEMIHFKDGRLIFDHGLVMQCTATHCNTLQLTATHCNTLQHTATHGNTLRYPAHQYRERQTYHRPCTCSPRLAAGTTPPASSLSPVGMHVSDVRVCWMCCVCVCVWERERERESVRVCVSDVCVCVCVHVGCILRRVQHHPLPPCHL